MKKAGYLLSIWMTVLFLSASVMTVRADTIWEPFGDFYEEYYQECKVVDENYLTNSKEGYVTIYESPVSSGEVAKIRNGKTLYVGCIWEDKAGKIWGAVDLWDYEPEEGEVLAENVSNGWALMDEFAEIYNENDFFMDHSGEFQEYAGEMDYYEIQDTLFLWTYPGSETVSDTLSAYFNECETPSYEYSYTDADGLVWTHISYYYGAEGWVCVDDPENENLTTSYGPSVKEQELYPQSEIEEEELKLQESFSAESRKTAVMAVAAVIVITAVLIAVIFRKRKETET